MGDAGFFVGYVLGLACGIAIGKKRQPWSEMSEGERKLTIGLIAVGVAALIGGIIVFILVRG
jgi:hypothetical protein